jgi:hypothetical protein
MEIPKMLILMSMLIAALKVLLNYRLETIVVDRVLEVLRDTVVESEQ